MAKVEDLKLLNIQSFILKMNIDCDGCKQKVKRLLQKIDGVYTFSIDADHQKVTVSGNIDPATLIRKLAKLGKHVELFTQKSNNNKTNNPKPNQDQQTSKNTNTTPIKGQAPFPNYSLLQGLKALKNQRNTDPGSFASNDEDGYDSDDDLLKLSNSGGKKVNHSGLKNPNGPPGYQSNPTTSMMQLQPPQVVYNNTAPQVAPHSGYYYSYPYYANPYESVGYGANLYYDEDNNNNNNCSVM